MAATHLIDLDGEGFRGGIFSDDIFSRAPEAEVDDESDVEFSGNFFANIFCEDENGNEEVQGLIQEDKEKEVLYHHYLKSINGTIFTRQIHSRGIAFQLWPAASTLVSIIENNPELFQLPSKRTSSPLRILEVGSGTGLVGITAAAILGAHVTITDLPSVLDNLQFNVDANRAIIGVRGGEVVVKKLSWGIEEDWMRGANDGSKFDLILGSDVIYHQALIQPLVKTAKFFVKGNVPFVMAYMKRWKKRETQFLKSVSKFLDFQVVHQDPPLKNHRTGVIVYRFVNKTSG
ncbi:putative methyltransferase family protein [Zostera marina]|uniref:Putative methyltransferase family protein n=1 Tax=Zostera marina TaxID=29655 RepID=A0A0K9NLC2_ZOSMR|nr:putative methyltransferase family protein [Zostera marina]